MPHYTIAYWQSYCKYFQSNGSHYCNVSILYQVSNPETISAVGSIVNVSSQASMRALPDHTSYGASKAAVDQVKAAI